jgi:hypothetical protein
LPFCFAETTTLLEAEMPRPTSVLKMARTATPLKGRAGYLMTAKRKAAIKKWQAAGSAAAKRAAATAERTAYHGYLKSKTRANILKSYKFRR